jgi:hypothetical protein
MINIELVTDDDGSRSTRDQLVRLLRTHDLSQWFITNDVRIEQGVVPHSHPVLTLNTRHVDNDDLLLATFLHEQLHWFLMTLDLASVERAYARMLELFPAAPVGFPEGGEDEESTYLHLIVNLLEYDAVTEVLGPERARGVIEHWTTDHYRWIYRQVLERGDEIRGVLVQEKLVTR